MICLLLAFALGALWSATLRPSAPRRSYGYQPRPPVGPPNVPAPPPPSLPRGGTAESP